MIHNYMEHVERIKLQQFNETLETSTVGRVRSEGKIPIHRKPLGITKLHVSI